MRFRTEAPASPRSAGEPIASGDRTTATTSRYEWMFWDMGYRREGWPI